MAQRVKRLPAMQETWVRSLGQEDPLEKGMATHSSTLAWKIPWTEKPGRLQSMLVLDFTLMGREYLMILIKGSFLFWFLLFRSKLSVVKSLRNILFLTCYWISLKKSLFLLYQLMEKYERTFWPTQYFHIIYDIKKK